jgi:hypothetical protein
LKKFNAQSYNIKQRIESLDLIENKDFELLNVQESRLPNQHGGSNGNKKIYMFNPKSFKKILMAHERS